MDSWRPLYAAGSASAVLYIVMIIVPLALVFTPPQPAISGGAVVLQYIASNKAIYLVELVCFVGLSIPALVVFLALSVSLKEGRLQQRDCLFGHCDGRRRLEAVPREPQTPAWLELRAG